MSEEPDKEPEIVNISGFGSEYYGLDLNGNAYSNHSGDWKKMKPFADTTGHLRISVYVNGVGKDRPIHQTMLETFVGPRPEGLIACHGKAGQRDNSLTNLKWGTYENNNGKDKLRDGTDNRGEKSAAAKLTWPEVREIRKLYGPDVYTKNQRRVMRLATYRSLAKQFNVGKTVIELIVKNKIWIEEAINV